MSDTTNDDDLHRQFHANIVDDIERHGRSIVCVSIASTILPKDLSRSPTRSATSLP